MKKIILSLSLLITVVLGATHANAADANPKVVSSFNKQFAGAQNVQWSEDNNGVHKAVFTWAGVRVLAFFDESGELIATERNIFFEQAPLTIARAVQQRFAKGTVLSVTEVSTESGLRYHLTIEENAKKIKTVMTSAGEIIEIVKVKK